MNKKFFTFLAASCVALTVNAQTIYYGADGKAQSGLGYVGAGVVDPRFPYTPFGTIDTDADGALLGTPVTDIKTLDKKLVQLVTTKEDGSNGLLAMQWNRLTNKYQLVLVDPAKSTATGDAADNSSNYFIDETLWEIHPTYVSSSKSWRYVLVNKGAQLPLQLSTSGSSELLPLHVQGGATTWSWSEVAEDENGLNGVLKAAVDSQSTLYLQEKEAEDGSLVAVKVDRTEAGDETGFLSFKAYEAAPIILTDAEQVNAMMTGNKKGDKVQFNMNPNVTPAGTANPLTDAKLKAINVDAEKEPGYFFLAKDGNTKNLLRVDTVYHNPAGKSYELKLTTNEIVAPREAYVIDEALKGTEDADFSLVTLATQALKQQAKFRFKYYPSDASVLLQTKQYLYLDKEAEQSWWKTLVMAEVDNQKAIETATTPDETPYTDYKAGAYYGKFVSDYTLDADIDVVAGATTEAKALEELMKDGAADNYYNRYYLTLAEGNVVIFANAPADWSNNLVKLTNLTPNHSELTVGFDARDYAKGNDGYKGINTLITIGTKKALNEVANLATGYYYVKNGNANTSDLLKKGDYRYHDLAATTMTNMYFSQVDATWNKGGVVRALAENIVAALVETAKNGGIGGGITDDDISGIVTSVISLLKNTTLPSLPNTVYSTEKINVPAAQWFVTGASDGGFYSIINRESTIGMSNGFIETLTQALMNGADELIPAIMDAVNNGGGDFGGIESNTDVIKLISTIEKLVNNVYLNSSSVYMWKVKDANGNIVPNTYACVGTAEVAKNDTIVLEQATVADLMATKGYMNMSGAVAKADTSLFTFKYTPLNGEALTIGTDNKNILTAAANNQNVTFKLERAALNAYDIVNKEGVTYKEYLSYGLDPELKDLASMVENADIDANLKDIIDNIDEYMDKLGIDPLLRRSLFYIYKEDVSSSSSEATGKRTRQYVTLAGGEYQLTPLVVNVAADGFTTYSADDNNGAADIRKQFFIKYVNNDPSNFVLVDPATTKVSNNAFIGVRAAVNQVSGNLQPSGLKSASASNIYENSLLSMVKSSAMNYRDVRRAGADRDTAVFYKNSNEKIFLYEGAATGANVSLLARTNDAQTAKNYAMFIDTANVSSTAKPMFLIGLRSEDFKEQGSNIAEHNRHLYTVADYLVVLSDSSKMVNGNDVYKYNGLSRLGFINAKHEGQKLIFGKDKEVDLSGDLTKASFAFRYVDTNRDAFYIETKAGGNTGWIRTINEIPVVTTNILDAEVFNTKATSDAPTANEGIAASEVSVVATTGAVIVKNAAGKKVVVSDVLGKTIAATTLTSDEATINVPAGIVFVTIDGNTVKTVVD